MKYEPHFGQQLEEKVLMKKKTFKVISLSSIWSFKLNIERIKFHLSSIKLETSMKV